MIRCEDPQACSPWFGETTGAHDVVLLPSHFAQTHAESDAKSQWFLGWWRKIYEAQDRGERPQC